MNTLHKNLSAEQWDEAGFAAQMLNIGSEISRAINWRDKNQSQRVEDCIYRALELLDMTISGTSGFCRRRELCRLRECIVDYFLYDNIYSATDKQMRSYFDCFLYLARRPTGKS